MIVDQFDEMLQQSEHQPLVCGIALHLYITGQLRDALRHVAQPRASVWLSTAGRIAQHIETLAPDIVPAAGG